VGAGTEGLAEGPLLGDERTLTPNATRLLSLTHYRHAEECYRETAAPAAKGEFQNAPVLP
jgi:hypothetical protein